MTLYTGVITHTQPSVATATSTVILAANNQRRYLAIQNRTGANIMLNFNNGTLTGIAPTSTNIGAVVANGGQFTFTDPFCPAGAVTVYHTAGSTINTICVLEGQ